MRIPLAAPSGQAMTSSPPRAKRIFPAARPSPLRARAVQPMTEARHRKASWGL